VRRDPDPPPGTGTFPAADLAALTAASSPGAAAEAALHWAMTQGAEGARLWIRGTKGRTHHTWSLERSLPLSSPAPPHPELDALAEDAMAGRAGTFREMLPARPGRLEDDPVERAWTCHPLPGATRTLGALAVATAVPAPSTDTAELLAAFLGMKLEQLGDRQRREADRFRQRGWFKTMDEQIRILERERQKLSALVNMTDAGVFVADLDGRVTWVNPVLARRGGGDRGTHARTCGDLLCGAKHDPCVDCPIQQVREGRPVVHKERREERGGQVHHVYVSAFPVRSPEGKVSEILVMLQDISDLETLRRSEARYHLLFERSADAMVMADPRTLEVIMANAQARRKLGLDPNAVPRPNLLLLHPPEIRKEMRGHYARIGRGRSLENVDVNVTAADGTTLTCNACGTLFDLDGSEVVLLEYRDVTHLRQLQEELSQAEHLIALGTMSAGIAHEFKNRLAPLRAFAQIISKQAPELERIERHAPIMIQEIDRLAALVRDILDYARPQEPLVTRHDLRDVVRGCADRFCTEYKEVSALGGLECELEIDEAPVPIRGDESQLDRAIFNVFKNGLDAVQDRDTPLLRCKVRREGAEGVVEFEDNGCGIPEQDLRYVFNPFFTTKGSRGTGLGMSITRSLLQANDGRIEIRSREGEGTTVVFRFPLASEEREAA
jgi:PAS domain S-box-containing protein